MKAKFAKYDVAGYLKSEEEMAACLEACFEEGATTRRLSRRRLAMSRVKLKPAAA